MNAFIIDGVRTPIGNFGGTLSPIRTDDLAAHVLRGLIARHPDLDPAAIGDVLMGCANQAGEDNRNVARMALLLAGLPQSVPGETVNRLCASGMAATVHAASLSSCVFSLTHCANTSTPITLRLAQSFAEPAAEEERSAEAALEKAFASCR